MANPRARPHGNTTDTEHYLPQRPPSWLQPSICTQPDFQSLNSSLDLLFMVNQHLRHHPFHTEPMPSQTYFQDQRAYNLLYRMRGDLILLDRLIDNLSQARRLLQFVTTGPGLPGQYRINPTTCHKLPRPPTSTLPLTPGNVHAPATTSHTAVANYNIEHCSNIPTQALQRPPCNLPTLRRHPCPRLLLHFVFQVSLIFSASGKTQPSNRFTTFHTHTVDGFP